MTITAPQTGKFLKQVRKIANLVVSIAQVLGKLPIKNPGVRKILLIATTAGAVTVATTDAIEFSLTELTPVELPQHPEFQPALPPKDSLISE